MNRGNKSLAAAGGAVFFVCLIVYIRSLGCGFINWDDQDYILNNSAIRALDWNLVSWAFTNHSLGWWFPLTWLSFALDYHFWGLNPLGYHLTNILLHAGNAVMVVLIADQLLTKRPGESGLEEGISPSPWILLLAGLLWGIHPLRVESVAWATERKDVLNGLFSLGAIFCYLCHARKMEVSGSKAVSKQFILSFILFICSLMAKQVSVVIPALLLLLDWFPLGRFKKEEAFRLFVEKWPFLLISIAMSLFTIKIGMTDSALATGLSFSQKLVISGNAVFEYCRLMLYPAGIIPLNIIPFPLPLSYAVKSIVVLIVSVSVLFAGKHPWIPATWLGFFLPLLPVLALTQNGIQSFAARFTYLPSVLPSIVAAYAVSMAYLRFSGRARFWIAGMSLLWLLTYGMISQRLIDVWKNSGTYWSRVISFQPFDRAYFYRGLYYSDYGNFSAAVADYSTALSIASSERLTSDFIANILAFRGEAYAKAGRYDEAIRDFSVSIEKLPHPLFYYHRAMALKAAGREAEAEADLRRAGSARGQMQWVSP